MRVAAHTTTFQLLASVFAPFVIIHTQARLLPPRARTVRVVVASRCREGTHSFPGLSREELRGLRSRSVSFCHVLQRQRRLMSSGGF